MTDGLASIPTPKTRPAYNRILLKLSGEVEMNHNGGILDDEIEEGYILACCSRPLTDVKVEA